MKIGQIIKDYRNTHKLTMQEFADRSGLSKGYISMLEKGVHPSTGKDITLTLESISKIAKGMNITTDSLVAMLDDNQDINIKSSPETTKELIERAFSDRPEMRALFDVADDAEPEDIEAVIRLLKK